MKTEADNRMGRDKADTICRCSGQRAEWPQLGEYI